MVLIKNIKTFLIDVALAEPFKISFQTFTHLNNLLVVVEDKEGNWGYGESASFMPITGDTREIAIKFLQSASERLVNKEIDSPENLHKELIELETKTKLKSQTAKAALDIAFYDLLGKISGKPIYRILGVEEPNLVKNTITIGLRSIEETVNTAKKYMELFRKNGLSRIKLKLSGDLKEDIERVLRVANVFDGELTLDANQAYRDPNVAVVAFKAIFGEIGDRVILIEEPCPKGDLDKLKFVKERSEIPIFADESAATYEDAKKVIEYNAADGINIKLQKAGGIYWGTRIAELANENGLKLMTGCMLETAISIAAGVHFASSINNMINTDLDSDLTLPVDIVKKPLKFDMGARIPSEEPGLGIELKNDYLPIIMDRLSICRAF